MAEKPFNDEELRRFGKFLETLGLRLQGDADFRRMLQGRDEEVLVDTIASKSDVLQAEFSEMGDEVIATITLPPGVQRQDVHLHVSRDALEVTCHGRLVTLATPTPVEEKDVRATYRNNVLDVVMKKARSTT